MSSSNLTSADAASLAYLRCVMSSDRDPDVEGFAVRLSTFVIHLLLAVLIRWSDEDVQSSVGVILLTSYSILIVTFASMARQQLSVADAHFALSITISPLTLYFVYASIRDCFVPKNASSRNTVLFSRLGKGGKTIRTLCLVLLLTWILLDLLIYFGGKHVFGKNECPRITLVGWFIYRFQFDVIALLLPVIFGLPSIPILYVLYSIRHLNDIRSELHRHKEKVVPWRHLRWVQSPWASIKSMIVSQWTVITSAHPWILLFFVALAYMTWASNMLVWIVDLQEDYRSTWNHTYPQFPVPNPTQTDYDPWGFGQLLAATCAVQPIYDTCHLIWERRFKLWQFIKRLPESVWDEIVFIFTGHRNPWLAVKADRRSPATSSHSDSIPLVGSLAGTPNKFTPDRAPYHTTDGTSRDYFPLRSGAPSHSVSSLSEDRHFS